MPVILGSPHFISCDELFGRRDGVPFDMTGKREYVKTFRVITRLKEMSEVSVALCPGLPLPYSFYVTPNGVEYDLLALATKMRCREEYSDDWGSWLVEVNYSTQLPPGGPIGFPGFANRQKGAANHPEVEPPHIEWTSEVIQVALRQDMNGKAFMHSANMPFHPTPTFPIGMAVLVMSRNELGFNSSVATNYSYALNDDTFLGYAPGNIQCMPPQAVRVFKGGYAYWRVTYKLRFAPLAPDNTWYSFQPKLLDIGQYRWDATRKIPVPILRNGISVTHPILLDGAGQPAVPDISGAYTPVFRNFVIYNFKPFANLLVNGMT